jgi:hypothetical protein
MTIKDVENSLDIILQSPQVITPYIHGKSGIGKSSICRQLAKKRDIAFIDLRLSQLESSDIRGIPVPDHKNGSSRWLPPETIPFENFAELYVPGTNRKFSEGGILLLDEINRARYDVLQAVFELVWDRRVGLHPLLDNWYIVCAGNLGDDDNTEVTEFDDSALNNRFIHFYVEDQGLFDCWINWAEGPGNVHSDVINFIKQKPSAIYTDPGENGVVFCTPRTWDNFSKILKQNSEVDPIAITTLVGRSYLGTTSVAFLSYLNQKVKVTPEDVIYKYPELRKNIKKMKRDEKYSISTELIAFVKDNADMNDKKINNIHLFITEQLDKDHMISAYKQLVDIMILYTDNKGDISEREFMDVYLDLYPEYNDKISLIIRSSKETDE